MSDCFFGEFRIKLVASIHKFLDDNSHLNYEFKLLFFLLFCHLQFRWVLVETDGAVLFCPFHSFIEFFMIIDAFCHTTDDLNLVNRFYTHSQIGFDEIRINDRSTNTHSNGTDLQPGFVSHGSYCYCCTSES